MHGGSWIRTQPMKTITTFKKGEVTDIATLWWLEHHGSLACQLIGYFITSDVLRTVLNEDQKDTYNPKKIAVLACDLAEAMYAEMDARDWILKLPPPKDALDYVKPEV